MQEKIINDNFVIHHLDYDNVFNFNKTISINNKKTTYCKSFYKEYSENFQKCINRLIPLHSICNYHISKIFKKRKNRFIT